MFDQITAVLVRTLLNSLMKWTFTEFVKTKAESNEPISSNFKRLWKVCCLFVEHENELR